MFSPLEDDWLAKQSVEGKLNIEKLKLWDLLREAIKPGKDLDGSVSSPDDIDRELGHDHDNWREIRTAFWVICKRCR